MSRIPLPELKEHIGRKGKLTVPPDGHVLRYTIKDEIRRPQTEMPQKILCLQLIEFEEDKAGRKRTEVRVGYYIIGKKPRMLGRWVWGQYAAMMPLKDFKALIRQAEKKGWF